MLASGCPLPALTEQHGNLDEFTFIIKPYRLTELVRASRNGDLPSMVGSYAPETNQILAAVAIRVRLSGCDRFLELKPGAGFAAGTDGQSGARLPWRHRRYRCDYPFSGRDAGWRPAARPSIQTLDTHCMWRAVRARLSLLSAAVPECALVDRPERVRPVDGAQ